ncbi:hypothetical protein BH09BAC6_BH09BAC6_32910 [soil metagenome]|jgi:hypothetical protein
MIRYFKILILFLSLIASSNACKASIVSKYIIKPGFISAESRESTEKQNIYYAIRNNYGVAQVSRPNYQRTLHFAKILFNPNLKYRNRLNTLSYNFYAGSTGHVRLRQLIIYPFHAFW